jgi:hypothetical protein
MIVMRIATTPSLNASRRPLLTPPLLRGCPGQARQDAAARRGVSSTIPIASAAIDTRLGEPVVTPWSHRNVRVAALDGLQLTLFTKLGSSPGRARGSLTERRPA